ncbi:hypothetical protein GCM10028803_04890 [Larkinella knui]|uniref:TonB C-terminal domain-containing protein n=1 Tax=Larkinella knui TaxID=2025310 RepID=A0A3P1CKH1_9BACT|nr:hypothetical protein [Larkinella knui]RRB13833.1 hypothetical protein EHT87_16370 [Larkinella knui]
MKSFFLLITILYGGIVNTLGQCTVTKDVYGQVITTCQMNSFLSENAPLNKQLTFLGSEFASFPVWQEGQIRLDQSGQDLACLLAYNVVSHEVLCRFKDDLVGKAVTPYSFVLNGIEYVRQIKSVMGINYTLYTTALSRGQTKLLKSWKGRFVKTPIRNAYDKDRPFAGYYQIDQRYYIQKGDAVPQPINLTKSSILSVLEDQKEIIDSKLPQRQLTVEQVIGVVGMYDSLTVFAQLSSSSLSTDAVFKELLRSQIKYPVQAWNAQVYARVYVGFEITREGQLTNIQLLSPENVGFGFKQEIEKALSKLAKTKQEYAGRYALPVSFTYTNALDKQRKFVPVNTLSTDLLVGRIVLNEFVVNQIMGKDVAKNREVWGYYK